MSHQRHEQGIGAGGAGNGVFDPHIGGQSLLQFFDLRSLDVLAVGQDALDSFHECRQDFLLLRFKIDKIEAP